VLSAPCVNRGLFGFRSIKVDIIFCLISYSSMATLLPPPKRQKVYHGVPEPPKEEPLPTPQIVVQFVSEDDGRSLAPAVNIPANVTREALELLVNNLSPEVCVP